MGQTKQTADITVNSAKNADSVLKAELHAYLNVVYLAQWPNSPSGIIKVI